MTEFHNQKHERKRGYSVPSTPRNAVRGSDSRVCQTDGPRKKRAAAISAGKINFDEGRGCWLKAASCSDSLKDKGGQQGSNSKIFY